ncbi:MAG: two-component system response regulator [Caulobacteraceae bacterium]|nr:two-component system response regulator [Caulobacteraceae bacterium]
MSVGLATLRVLLVDDNKHMRAIVSAVLHGLGVHNQREASDGKEALDALNTWPADLAVADFAMLPMDGVEFTRRVRNDKDSRNPYLPIIMMTGHADKGRVVEARDAGVTELLVKPVTARDVIDRLNTVIFHPRPFIRTADYFGPLRRGVDDAGKTRNPQRFAEI